MLGSASPDLLRQSTESRAGRIAYIELAPFTIDEVSAGNDLKAHWMRGGFPERYLAGDEAASFRWREQFGRTFLDRDIPALGIDLTRSALERLWTMVAVSNATVINRAKLADPVVVSPQTIARYIDILENTFMIRLLRPFFHNTRKRLVRRPTGPTGTHPVWQRHLPQPPGGPHRPPRTCRHSTLTSPDDRVLQMATKLVIEPIFEADFQESSYGFRPKRSATQAMEAVREAGNRGYNYVVDADIRGYLD